MDKKELKIVSRYDSSKILLYGQYESVKDCLEKNKHANLRNANLSRANLFGANLFGAYLFATNLSGIKNYYNSHDIAIEIIKRQDVKYFTEKGWAFIGELVIHRFCWGKVREYKQARSVCKKLDKLGYGEYLKTLVE